MQLSDVPHALPAPVWAVIGAAAVALITWIFNRGKTKAETRKLNKEGDAVELKSTIDAAQTIMHMIEKLRQMEHENSEKDRVIEDKNHTIEILVKRLSNKGNGRAE